MPLKVFHPPCLPACLSPWQFIWMDEGSPCSPPHFLENLSCLELEGCLQACWFIDKALINGSSLAARAGKHRPRWALERGKGVILAICARGEIAGREYYSTEMDWLAFKGVWQQPLQIYTQHYSQITLILPKRLLMMDTLNGICTHATQNHSRWYGTSPYSSSVQNHRVLAFIIISMLKLQDTDQDILYLLDSVNVGVFTDLFKPVISPDHFFPSDVKSSV